MTEIDRSNHGFEAALSKTLVSPDSAFGIFFQVGAPFCALACFIFPGITIAGIVRARSTLSVPALPFLSMFTQCSIWLVYGFLQHSSSVIAPNLVGAILGFIYVVLYNKFSPLESRGQLFFQYMVSFVILVATFLIYIFASKPTAIALIGIMGASGSVLFTASPLIAVVTVLRTKSTQAMPFITSCVLFLNGTMWFGLGFLVANDSAIWIPNLLGACAGLLQLLVHLYIAVSKDTRNYEYDPISSDGIETT